MKEDWISMFYVVFVHCVYQHSKVNIYISRGVSNIVK